MTDLAEELAAKSYEDMTEKELVYLKDHCLLPIDVEMKYFKSDPQGGRTTFLPEGFVNTGDMDTKNSGFASGLQPEGVDLSGIDRAEEAERKVEEMRQQLAQTEAERDALLAANEAEEEEDDDRPYDEYTVAELHGFIDERNAARADEGLDPLPKPRSKGETIEVLEEDDETE